MADEARALGLRLGAWAWIREVQLLGDGQPWVFARTLIPADTLRGRGRRLTRLGTRPLGEVLFTDPGVRRGPVNACISGRSPPTPNRQTRSGAAVPCSGSRNAHCWSARFSYPICRRRIPVVGRTDCHHDY